MASPESPTIAASEGRIRLPAELEEFLFEQDVACVTETTNCGTAMIIKLPSADIESIRGSVPIQVRHELFQHPASPVIRLVFSIYDKPMMPLVLEAFVNVASYAQRSEYARMGAQKDLPLLFYDEVLQHRLSKVIAIHNQSQIRQIVTTADQLLVQLPESQRDFDLAKSMVLARYPLA